MFVEKRALITDLQDKMLVLLVEEEEAQAAGNIVLAARLRCDVDRLKAECADIRRSPQDPVGHSPRLTR